MSVMELIGQGGGTILYGDRYGDTKVFKAPFRGYVKSVMSDGEDPNLTVTINGRVVHDIPSVRPSENNSFEYGDAITVTGTPTPSVKGDRVGLDVGTIPGTNT